VLERPGGAENVNAFLNVLGKGENALLTKANKQARFENLNDVLNPTQIAAKDRVAGELVRDLKMQRAASEGAQALGKTLQIDASPLRLPAYMNWASSTFNAVSSKLQGRVSEKTLLAISEAMKSGKATNDLLTALPSSERNLVMKALRDSNALGKAATASTVNSLASEDNSVNALNRK